MPTAKKFFQKGVTLGQLEALYNIPHRTLRDWERDSDHPIVRATGNHNQKYYRLDEHVQYMVRRLKRKGQRSPMAKLPAEIELLEAKARRERIRADKEEEIAVNIEDISAMLIRREVAARNAFKGLSQRLAQQLSEESDPHTIAEILQTNIDKALEQLPTSIRA